MTAPTTALRDDARAWLEQAQPADVIVGIPSYKNAATVGHVVQVVGIGLSKYFPGMQAAIVNSDGGSPDGTRDVVRGTPVPKGMQVLSTQYQGSPGKGSAFRAIFEIAAALGAKACVVVDSDLRSITPEWIDRLAGPILREGFGYVAPLYTRHKHDGTITNNITYPMTRMLYGLDVRQPIGGDFGFAGSLARWWLTQDVWDTDVARYGIDIWMTTTAIAEGFRVCQAGLGLKIHDAKDPASSLGPMFSQVVGTLFSLMARYADKWQAVQPVQPAPLIGELPHGEPEDVPVTVPAMIAKLRAGVHEHEMPLQQALSPNHWRALQNLAGQNDAAFTFPPDIWAHVVFDLALAYNLPDAERPALIAALVPLYYGRVAGMVRQAKGMDSATFEREVVQAQANVFERLKPKLTQHWRRRVAFLAS